MNMPKSQDIHALFGRALHYIINVLILFIILVLVVGLAKTLFSFTSIFSGELHRFDLSIVVTDILTFLVMIELFRSFIDYFKAKRLRLHSMIDPAIIIIVRELIVKLYSHAEVTERTLVGFGVLLLCLGVIRTMAVCFSPTEEGKC